MKGGIKELYPILKLKTSRKEAVLIKTTFAYSKYAFLRDKLGVTDYRVAADTGIQASTFTFWRSGRCAPKIDKVMRLANYFGVPVTFFVNDRE